MPGRIVHFAAAIAVTIAGVSAARAGGAPNCCAPVIASCGNCGSNPPTIIYGPTGYYAPEPIYRVNQGPVYNSPVLPYGEPEWAPQSDAGPYPYVAPYGYGFPFSYPGYGRRGFHHHHGVNVYRHAGIPPRGPYVHGFGPPRMRTGFAPARFVGHRPMVRGPMVRRVPAHRPR